VVLNSKVPAGTPQTLKENMSKTLKIKEVLSILLIPVDEETVLYKALDELYELGYTTGYCDGLAPDHLRRLEER
jgi:hypothetical protein